MRYVIVILLALLLATPAFAATDNTGLKVFALTPDKMLGPAADVNYEDSANFPVMQNLVVGVGQIEHFRNGSIITKDLKFVPEIPKRWYLIESNGEVYSWAPSNSLLQPMLYTADTGSITIGSHEVLLGADSTGFNGELFITDGLYLGNPEIFCVCANGIKVLDKTSPTSAALYSSTPFSSYQMRTYAIWKNRLFAAGGDYLLWSKSGDFTNFSIGSFNGGVLRFNPACLVYKLVDLSDGLCIFTSDGIYYLSGGTPETWRLSKISGIMLAQSTFINSCFPIAKIDNQTIIFMDNQMSIYSIKNGYTVSKITDYPFKYSGKSGGYVIFTGLSLFYDRFIVLSNAGNLAGLNEPYSYVYDMQQKCWYKWNSIVHSSQNYYTTTYLKDIVSGDRHFAVRNKDILSLDGNYSLYESLIYMSLPTWVTEFYKIYFESPYYTLDGITATFKKVKRIELECQGYGYKNTSAYYDGGVLTGKSTNVIALNVSTEKNTTGITREVSLEDNVSSTVSLNEPTQNYILRYPELGEARKFKLKFETTGGIIIRSIKFYYEIAGVK